MPDDKGEDGLGGNIEIDGAVVRRRPYRDIREWIGDLESAGQLCRVRQEVDWRFELASVLRRTWDVYGDASPALLFENIKDYPPPGPNKLFTGAFRSWYRTAMMLGLDPDQATRGRIIAALRRYVNDRSLHLAPVVVDRSRAPVKQNVLRGDDVDMEVFPVPYWNERDGGRFIGSMHGVVTADPDTGWLNLGTYRMMMHNKTETGIQADPANQHIGRHFYKYIERNQPMPAAMVIGADPALTFLFCSPTLEEVSEYEIAGAIRGEPVEVVRCETSDLLVPANAEIVIEGTIHPKERKLEGPCGEYPGYYGSVPGPKPVFRAHCITFRDDPIFRGTLEGHPVNEDHMSLAISQSVYAWDVLEKLGVPGVRGVAMPLDACGYGHCVVSIKPLMEGHADMVASAIWGSKGGIWSFKHVIVVDEDIDPWNTEQVNWSICWRVRASEDVKIWPRHRGSRLDPRIPPEEKGFQDRMLIDATRPYHWAPREIWGSEGVRKGVPLKFPPTTRPQTATAALVNERWERYGVRPVERYIGRPEGMFKHWWEPEEIERVRSLKVMP
jgi:UbiD family decarboxylase